MADAKISALPASTVPLAGTEVLPIVQSSATKKVSVANLTDGRAVSMSSATIGPNPLALSGAVVDVGNNRNSPTRFGISNQNTGASATAGLDLEAAGGGWQIDVPADVVTFANPLIGKFGGTEKFRFLATGSYKPVATAGVDYTANTPAAGMTSQLLNWYEEGTWTGTLGGQTTDPTTPVTATGLYTRIGRQVTVQIYFVNVDTTGGSGNMEIRGLPFTPKGTTNDHYIGSCESYGLDVPNKYNVAFVAGSVTKILFQSMADDAAWTEPQLTAGTTKFLAVTLTYFV